MFHELTHQVEVGVCPRWAEPLDESRPCLQAVLPKVWSTMECASVPASVLMITQACTEVLREARCSHHIAVLGLGRSCV